MSMAVRHHKSISAISHDMIKTQSHAVGRWLARKTAKPLPKPTRLKRLLIRLTISWRSVSYSFNSICI